MIALVAGLGGTVFSAPVAHASPADFNGDGFADLAISAVGEGVNGAASAGAVNVLYGSASGLSAVDDQIWHRDSEGVPGAAQTQELLGLQTTDGDFDGDGYSDLAITVGGADPDGVTGAGSVLVLFGSATGLTAAGVQTWHQGTPGVSGVPEQHETFGSSLAASDFDGDSYGDLAIASSCESVGELECAGAVNILYGSKNGLTAAADQIWHQDSDGILGFAGVWDFFGAELAAADYNCDGYGDLAIGVTGEHPGGAVSVLYGSGFGLSATGNQLWSQDSVGISGTADWLDGFGSALAEGDFDNDGCVDLAIGVGGETVGNSIFAGAVHVLFGTPGVGLSSEREEFWSQASPGVRGQAEGGDQFGSDLVACDFDGDGADDLAIGVKYEQVGDIYNAVAVNILYGASGSGLTSDDDQIWHQDTTGVPGNAEAWDQLSRAGLASGDFDDDGACDLAISVVDDTVDGLDGAGAVNLLYGLVTSGLLDYRAEIWHQNTAGVRGKAEAGDGFGGL